MNGKDEAVNGKDGHVDVEVPAGPAATAEEIFPSCTMSFKDAVQNRPEENGYYGAPLPTNEKERHETLCACQILDSQPDPRFDDITKLVCTRPLVLHVQLFSH